MWESVFIPMLIFGLPLLLLTISPFGWLKSRMVYLILAVLLLIAQEILFLFGVIASTMSKMGAGAHGPTYWDGFGPLILLAGFSFFIITFGCFIRAPKSESKSQQDGDPDS